MKSSRKCGACGETKPVVDFGRNQTLTDGLSVYCLECNREYNRSWYRNRRRALGKPVRDDSWIPAGFRWCATCEQLIADEDFTRSRKTASGFGSQCKACKSAAASDSYFYSRYKLTRKEVAALRVAQDNRCAICGDPEPQHLDHDHEQGGIRQLLCQRCNHGIGLFRDDPALLHLAAFYVQGHRERQALSALADAAGIAPEGASRPGTPPVGSDRRPGGRGTTSRSNGHTSRSRPQRQPGEAEH